MPTTRSVSLRIAGGMPPGARLAARQAAQPSRAYCRHAGAGAPRCSGRWRSRPRGRARQPPGDHPRVCPPGAGTARRRARTATPTAGHCRGGLDVQADHRGHHGSTRQPGQRAVVAADPGPVRRDKRVGGLRCAEEPRVGAVGPPRPRGSGQDSAPADGHQQGEQRPAAPAGPKHVRGDAQNRAHLFTRSRSGGRRCRTWVEGRPRAPARPGCLPWPAGVPSTTHPAHACPLAGLHAHMGQLGR